MTITVDQLKQIMPHARSRANEFLDPLNDAMDEFEIDTPQRQAAFLAQISHESGELRYVAEIASGKAYEGRADLGNTEPGDGMRFKGRGLIQITGRDNNASCGCALGLDLLADPELLEDPVNAARSAAWFWSTHGCNELADAGNFRQITLRINGGFNGYDERVSYWESAKEAIA
jgi:putative chitinase